MSRGSRAAAGGPISLPAPLDPEGTPPVAALPAPSKAKVKPAKSSGNRHSMRILSPKQLEALSRGRAIAQQKKINWDKQKVFDQPAYRLPYKFRMYIPGKKPKDLARPERWVQAAIESGLAVMGSPSADGRVGGFFEPIGKQPTPYVPPGHLERLLAEGTANNMRILEEHARKQEEEKNKK